MWSPTSLRNVLFKGLGSPLVPERARCVREPRCTVKSLKTRDSQNRLFEFKECQQSSGDGSHWHLKLTDDTWGLGAAELQMQLKLTSGPKKSALLMLRKKIEAQNEKVLAARENFLAARKVAPHPRPVLHTSSHRTFFLFSLLAS